MTVPEIVTVPEILITIPLTFSIANGLAFGFTAYAVIQLFLLDRRKVNWLVYALAALFIARFAYLSHGP